MSSPQDPARAARRALLLAEREAAARRRRARGTQPRRLPVPRSLRAARPRPPEEPGPAPAVRA
ncbi:hypothetical protein FHR75_001163 [Kineococcus radiotolerans]|uniref:Uncharacterized protein n=1 Tax=Kineococcus radiotolerans TaxID=131568 RepID=A0A7W4XWQ4_KINRA|nr:hypothetical protein [Kineococcus radiotolerans]MBB2900375.1 hypothetical protein [Kineococcus radiotolerans]